VGGEVVKFELVGDSSGSTVESVLGNGTLSSSEWRKYVVKKTTSAGDTTLRIRLVAGSTTTPTFYVGAAQLEQKSGSHPTSYCDSTLGGGYSAMARQAGLHHLGTIAANSGMPFTIGQDGAIVSNDTLLFRGERHILKNIQSDQTHFLFTGSIDSNTASFGDEHGVVKIRNATDGNVLYIDADLVTTQFGQVISAGGLTTGAVLALAIPSDLSGFTGDFFLFPSKSGLILGRLNKNKFKWGSDMDVLQKSFETWGGGKWSSSTTTMTGTVTTATASATVSGSGTSFDTEYAVGDLIRINSVTRRITVITDADTLTVNQNWGSVNSGVAHARHDDQYMPAMYVLERSTSPLTDGTGDHFFTQGGAPLSAWINDQYGLPIWYRGTVNETVPAPSSDTDSYRVPVIIDSAHTPGSDDLANAIASTTEATVWTSTLPARILGTAKRATMRIWGRVLRNGTDTFVIRGKFGSTTMTTSGNITTTNNASYVGFMIEFTLWNKGATNSQEAVCRVTVDGSIDTNPVSVAHGSATEDTTSALAMFATVDWSATDAASSFEPRGAELEIA